MSTHAKLRLSAVVVPAFLFAACWFHAAACPVPRSLLSADQIKEALTPPCVEFWINRYQTAIGVFAALLAAWAAWSGVQRQVNRADKQIQIARVQFSSSFLSNIQLRINNVKIAMNTCYVIERAFDEFSLARDALGEMTTLLFKYQIMPQSQMKQGEQVVRCNHMISQLESLVSRMTDDCNMTLLSRLPRDSVYSFIAEMQSWIILFQTFVAEAETLYEVAAGNMKRAEIFEIYGPPPPLKYKLRFEVTLKALRAERTRLEVLHDRTVQEADQAVVN